MRTDHEQFSGTPKVSVTVVTYNHGNWPAQCLESIVTQKTDFPFEVIVGDDASTDGRTVEVLREYASKYPEVIVPIFREKMLGQQQITLTLLRVQGGAILLTSMVMMVCCLENYSSKRILWIGMMTV
jgi:glycosyltransferase involved in cell wall biosynthesis